MAPGRSMRSVTIVEQFRGAHPVAGAQGFYAHKSPRREPGDVRIKAPGASRGIENHGGFFPGVTYTVCATSSEWLESVESSGCHSGMPR